MLIGEYKHKLDAKKRLSIPSKFRKELGERAVLSKGLDGCLFLFSVANWEEFVHKLGELKLGQQESRNFSRHFLTGAVEVDLDVLGRILVPDYLKKTADLKKKAVITGVLNRIEIWDEERWETMKAGIEKNSDGIAQKLGDLGII